MLRFHYFVYQRDKTGHTHPVYDCYHMAAAQQERRNLDRENFDGSLFFVGIKVDAYDLTKMESFVKLVYDTRELQKEYFGTKEHDTMLKAMNGEKQIDGRISSWVSYCASHPDYKLPYELDQKLFETVRDWRKAMKEWSAYKLKDDHKLQLMNKCKDYESLIDNLIKYRLENYREFR